MHVRSPYGTASGRPLEPRPHALQLRQQRRGDSQCREGFSPGTHRMRARAAHAVPPAVGRGPGRGPGPARAGPALYFPRSVGVDGGHGQAGAARRQRRKREKRDTLLHSEGCSSTAPPCPFPWVTQRRSKRCVTAAALPAGRLRRRTDGPTTRSDANGAAAALARRSRGPAGGALRSEARPGCATLASGSVGPNCGSL